MAAAAKGEPVIRTDVPVLPLSSGCFVLYRFSTRSGRSDHVMARVSPDHDDDRTIHVFRYRRPTQESMGAPTMKPRFSSGRDDGSRGGRGRPSLWLAVPLAILLAGASFFAVNWAA